MRALHGEADEGTGAHRAKRPRADEIATAIGQFLAH
jgi:hypothetical protein